MLRTEVNQFQATKKLPREELVCEATDVAASVPIKQLLYQF